MGLFYVCVLVLASYTAAYSSEDNVYAASLENQIPYTYYPLNRFWEPRLKNIIDKITKDLSMSKLEQNDRKKFKNNINVGSSIFKCPIESSRTTPTSVHKLRPADIKVVGAIGDSLTAGNGILAKTILGLLVQYRGSAFSIGGQHKLTTQVTLPNILKLYNTKLTGYSTGSSGVGGYHSKLNFAEPGKKAEDMPQQARDLVAEMKKSSNGVDFKNDWKLITVFIGGNDICDYCKDKNLHSVANYKKHLQEALDILHKEVPRAFVNLLEVLNVALAEETQTDSKICSTLVSGFLCRCAASPDSSSARQEIANTISGYQAAVRELVDSGRYDTRSDFTVVVQPFMRNSEPPRINGKFDVKYLAPDCFHFSALGHAAAAKALWNNMLEPVGKKSDSWTLDGEFLCPTKSRPYFATAKN